GIYFRDDEWDHDNADESLALTNQLFGDETGTIGYADIEINTKENIFSVQDGDPGLDLQSVITHEVGHYIGLAHSKVSDSIMVARYCQSDARCASAEAMHALADDDITAVCAMYPPNADTGTIGSNGNAGCAVGANAGSSGSSGSFGSRAFDVLAIVV